MFINVCVREGAVYGENEEWCIADEQTPDEELQAAMDWACGKGGADCSKIQEKQSCFLPNTVRSHASFAFNSYFQKFKHAGGSCYFRGASTVTQEDPSMYLSHHYILSIFFPLTSFTPSPFTHLHLKITWYLLKLDKHSTT